MILACTTIFKYPNLKHEISRNVRGLHCMVTMVQVRYSMVCPPVRSITHSLKLVDYLSVQADKPCSISRIEYNLSLFPLIG